MQGYANMLLRILGIYLSVLCLRCDLTQATPKINKPALVLCGDQDIATSPDLGRELARAIPGAHFSLINEAGHLACIEQPEPMARQMMEFFQEVNLV
jgi:3-oxoadipate enol-lactonase